MTDPDVRALDEAALRKLLSRTELLRVLDEFRSERDAAKRDAMRAFDERNIALARAEAAEAECARLRQMILWALGESGEFPTWPDTVTIKGSPKFWWRKELRARFDAAIAEGKHEA